MRFTHMLFGLPLVACLAMMAVSFAVPLRSHDQLVVTAYEATHVLAVPDLTVTEPAHVAILAEEQRTAAPSAADAHQLAYVVENQPGADWRVAADTTFAIIDPHIRSV